MKRNCANLATLGELGEFPVNLKGLVSLLSFWHRSVTQMEVNTLIYQAVHYVSEEPSQSEWFATVKCLLKELNMHNYLLDPTISSTEDFKAICKTAIKNLFSQYWTTTVMNQGEGSKLRFYKQFKFEFVREPYLDLINNYHLRQTITKFRCSDHRLEIELGRHNKTKPEERICKICRGSVESEIHFLIECSLYRKFRIKYLGIDINQSWLDIIQCKDKNIAFNFGNFLTKSPQKNAWPAGLFQLNSTFFCAIALGGGTIYCYMLQCSVFVISFFYNRIVRSIQLS